ncbi:MAG: GNAT family N-acetyltransferase, partial [Hyphomicrobiaceae bacterium]
APDVLAVAVPLMTRANPALLGSGTFYVAETADHQIVGCGGWTMQRPGTGEIVDGLAHIRHFATHPDRTGNGIGRALYDTCAREAKHAAVSRFECFASLNAQEFYMALGFEPIGRINISIGPGVDFQALHMQRGL